MKHVIAIVLLCLPTQLSAAAERCTSRQVNRDEVARTLGAKAIAARVEVVRAQKTRPIAAWQRSVLFEQQIL